MGKPCIKTCCYRCEYCYCIEKYRREPGETWRRLYTALRQRLKLVGGKALPIQVDIRFEEQVQAAVQKAVEVFGGIDIVINNASAIQLTNTLQTEMKPL